MTVELMQRFPIRTDEGMSHRTWCVDVDAAHRVGQLEPKRLRREISEMGEHFPHWILTVAKGNTTLRCVKCQGMLVFDRGVRCVSCDAVDERRGGMRIGFFGLMPPVGIDSLDRIKKGLQQGTPKQHLVGHRDGLGTFLLVPLLVTFPADYPQQPVVVSYLPGIFEIPGMPRPTPSHDTHLLSEGTMCLFASGQWQSAMTCREVLQQRAYAHVIKLLRFGNGKRDAFAVVS